ncbi:MAG: NAD(P)-dependent oxidoreductase [Bosea sp.]|nr:NAD(P)-dependent oxidoreductase [Bosea sp. (in: a-proteobacteria)]
MQILVTGGTGFIGAWIVRSLLAAGHKVRIFDIKDDSRLVRALAGEAAAEIDWRLGDIRDGEAVHAAAEGCDSIVHLAALLTPACREQPVLGAGVIVIGTLNVFEAARRHGIAKVVYASSAGVFGPEDGARPLPITHYGAFKLATEGSARAYWLDHGIASVGFRPFVVYGPGRELGLTAGPSLAAEAAAKGEAYEFIYTGQSDLLYVEDLAAAFAAAVARDIAGAHAFNLVGEVATVDEVIAEIRRQVPDARLSAAGPGLPTAPELAPDASLPSVLGTLPRTGLAEGLARTIAFHRDAARALG